MIPILFDKTETEFKTNGLGTLVETTECVVTEERNGVFEIKIRYPMSGKKYKYLKTSMIILAKANEESEDQAFRIYKIGKPINKIVTIYGEHISYRLSHITIPPMEAESSQQAFTKFKEESVEYNPYTFMSYVGTQGIFKSEVPASIRSRLGGVEGSILDVYGGEYEFDNYRINLHAERGSDKGVTIRYGKNLIDVEQEESIETTITGIYPYWKKETEYMQLPEKTIYSENANNYPYKRTVAKDFTEQFEEKPTEEELREATQNYIKNNDIGVPSVSLDVEFEQIWQTEEYKGKLPITKVGLCDTVTVIFEELGINAKAKVIEYEYDTLLERYKKLKIGESRTNLSDKIIEQEKTIEKKVDGTFLDSAIKNATDWITGNKGGYIIFRTDANGAPYEMLVTDTDDYQTAKNVWRWNQGGLGHSKNGYNGPYSTAMTQDGKFIADFIAAGKIQGIVIEGNEIKGGTIDGTTITGSSLVGRTEGGLKTVINNGDISIYEELETESRKVVEFNSFSDGTRRGMEIKTWAEWITGAVFRIDQNENFTSTADMESKALLYADEITIEAKKNLILKNGTEETITRYDVSIDGYLYDIVNGMIVERKYRG